MVGVRLRARTFEIKSDKTLNTSNVGTLTTKWTVTTNGTVNTAPAVVNGVIYFGSFDHKVYVVNTTSGAALWTVTTAGAVLYSSPAFANGVVYVGSEDDKAYALSASTGNALWTFDAGSCVFSSPAVAKGVVYVASTNDEVNALDASTGAALWTATRSANNETLSPAVGTGRVYIGFDDNRL